MGVIEAEALIEDIERDHESDERHEAEAQENEGQRVLAREAKARQCVSGGNAGGDGQCNRAQGDD